MRHSIVRGCSGISWPQSAPVIPTFSQNSLPPHRPVSYHLSLNSPLLVKSSSTILFMPILIHRQEIYSLFVFQVSVSIAQSYHSATIPLKGPYSALYQLCEFLQATLQPVRHSFQDCGRRVTKSSPSARH